MTVEDFHRAILTNPFLAIYVINAIDCRGLDLLSHDVTAAFVRSVNVSLAGIPDEEIAARAEEIVGDAMKTWGEQWAEHDKHRTVQMSGYQEVGTVTTFASFSWSYATAYNAAEAFIDEGDLAKVDALIKRLRGKIIHDTPLSEAQVDVWIGAIAKASASGVPLVKRARGTIWVAPKVEADAEPTATDYRNRLGLVHLPLNGQTNAEQATLMRISFEAMEFASKCSVKRPCMFDHPGPRFRALTAEECRSGCTNAKEHGFTVDMSTDEYADGQSELTYRAEADARFERWSLTALGRLTGLHPDAHDHEGFMKHLLKRDPEDSSAGMFRRSPPWDLCAELRSLL